MDMEFDDGVRKYAADLVNEATEGDIRFNEALSKASEITRDLVLDLLRKARVPLARRNS